MKKMTNLKKTISVFTALVLAIAICLSAFGTNAYAASENGNLKIKYKGKTVVLDSGAFSHNMNMIKIKNVKKAWGKPNKTVTNEESKIHTYKKGKTKITLYTKVYNSAASNGYKKGYYHLGDITIKDKNASLAGVKVGMSKNTAMKKLKKYYGTNKIDMGEYFTGDKRKISRVYYENGAINVFMGPFMPIEFIIKKGKVTEISWMRS